MKKRTNKKVAVLLADTRHALVGQMLVQLSRTNKDLFDEAVIFDDGFSQKDKEIMAGIMPCRFLPYVSPLEGKVPKTARMRRFSLLMFARYEMFRLLSEYQLLMWIDTDMVIQGSLSELLDSTNGYGFSILCEDPNNKSKKNVDYMRSNFFEAVDGYRMDTYLYCTGLIIARDCLEQSCDYTEWCYQKTIQWAANLNLPDQGVLNALIQNFNFPVKPLGDHGRYACFPYIGRDCGEAITIHSWGENKFWSDWYLNLKFPNWEVCYQIWISLGGSPLKRNAIPETSVIIPTYKPDIGYFKQCLDGLVQQKKSSHEAYSNFEVIIVAEPFGQESITAFIESYHDPRIQVHFNTERLGIAASLNVGMRKAKGTFIARIDDDDIAAPQRLFKQVAYLNNHPDISVCVSDYEYFGDMNEGRRIFEGEMSRAWSLLTCPFDHPTVMLRRDFFQKNELEYDVDQRYAEDWDLWMRAFDKGMTVGCIHEALLYHRWHNGSAGQTEDSNTRMKQIIQENFKKLGIDIPWEIVPAFSPWWGKAWNDQVLAAMKEVFSQALAQNKNLKLYDQDCLEKVFSLRLHEAETGKLPNLSWDVGENAVERINSEKAQREEKPSFIRRIFKKLVKPLYRPFRHRYEDRIINIQEVTWSAEGAARRTEDALLAHIAAQTSKMEQITVAMETLQCDYQNLLHMVLKQSEDTRQILSSKIFEQAEDTRQVLSSKIFEQSEDTRQVLSSKIFEQSEDTRQVLSSKIFEQSEGTRQVLSSKIFEQSEGTRQVLSSKIFEQSEDTRQVLSSKIFEQSEDTRQVLSSKIFEQAEDTQQRLTLVGDHLYDLGHNVHFYQRTLFTAQAQKRKIVLLGSPEHSNIGDAAITLGELKFFQKYFADYQLVELSVYDFNDWYPTVKSIVRRDDILFLQGGGNLGSQYPNEEELRRRVISDFSENQIVIFPQTIYFDSTPAGQAELEVSTQVYGQHRNLMLFTRGQKSLHFAMEHFGQTQNAFAPDMALLLRCDFNLHRSGVLLCLRNLSDAESGLTAAEADEIEATVRDFDPHFRRVNNLNRGNLEANILLESRQSVVSDELKKYASSSVVVTDRLHGLIFSIITGTPCVALCTYNEKITEFCAMLTDSNAVFYIGRDIEKLPTAIKSAQKVRQPIYPLLEQGLFDRMAADIRKAGTL